MSESVTPPLPTEIPETGGKVVLARVGDYEITEEELETAIKSKLLRIEREYFEAKRQALQGMISQKVLEEEILARNVTMDELFKAEVDSKVPEISQEEIEDYYKENKAYAKQPLSELESSIRTYLRNKALEKREQVFIDQLKENIPISIYLEPPRSVVPDDGDPAIGPPDAPIQIIEFSDFQCPYCKRGYETLKEIREHYGDLVRIVYRDYPLQSHTKALMLAEAAQCANDQNKFWELHDKIFENQHKLEKEDLQQYASDLNLDMDVFNECLDSHKYGEEVKSDLKNGSELGVSGTPCFFINGIYLSGARPYDDFDEIIRDELRRKNIPLP